MAVRPPARAAGALYTHVFFTVCRPLLTTRCMPNVIVIRQPTEPPRFATTIFALPDGGPPRPHLLDAGTRWPTLDSPAVVYTSRSPLRATKTRVARLSCPRPWMLVLRGLLA